MLTPRSLAAADLETLAQLDGTGFLRVWCSVVYLNPGLHTDNILDPGTQYPEPIMRVLREVCRRADAGELADEEIYPYPVIQSRLAANKPAIWGCALPLRCLDRCNTLVLLREW